MRLARLRTIRSSPLSTKYCRMMRSRVAHFGTDRIDRVPGVVANGEREAAIGDESIAPGAHETAVRGARVNDGADMGERIVARQINEDGDGLPVRVGMRRDVIAGNVAGEHRNRKQADIGEVGTEAAPQSRPKPPHERRLELARTQDAADQVPYATLPRRQKADVLRKQIDLDPRRCAALAVPAAARHRPVVGRLRHGREHVPVEVGRKKLLELDVMERRVHRLGVIHRFHQERGHLIDRNRIVHHHHIVCRQFVGHQFFGHHVTSPALGYNRNEFVGGNLAGL